jgi:CspA family cold shock protein
MLGTQKGTIKWYNPSKGYGFIKRENEDDIFAHHSRMVSIRRTPLCEGDKVEFYVAAGIKGLVADKIKVID